MPQTMWDQFQTAPVAEAGKPPTQANNPELAMPTTMANSGMLNGLHGEEFLTELEKAEPGKAALLRQVGEGRAPYPSGFMMKTPAGQFLVTALAQAYPNMTAQDFHTKQKTADDFKSGPSSKAVKSANQAILHANTALEASEALGGLDTLPVLNSPINAVRGQFSTDYQTHKATFEGAINAMSTELSKSFAGKPPALAEIEHWRKNVMTDDSPTTRRAAIMTGMKLLNGSLESLVDQYNKGMLTNSESVDLLAPHNKELFTRLLSGEKPTQTKTAGFTGKYDSGSGAAAAPAPGNYVYDPATKTLKPAQ